MAPKTSRSRATKAAAQPSGGATKGKRKAAVEEEPAPRVARPRLAAKNELGPVAHASHGKVPGQLFVFGDGDCGQLGLGEDVTERLRPFPLDVDGNKILQVACGGMHTVALTEDHVVYSWGVNDEGALGRETAGELWEKSGLSSGKTGDAYTPGLVNLPAAAGKVVQLSAGDSHTAALTELGSVWAWGTFRDSSGVFGFSAATRIQLTPVEVYRPRRAEDQVLRIVSGADHVAAITRHGGLLTWGNGQQGQLARVGERLSDRVRAATLLTPAPVPLRRRRAGRSAAVDVAAGTYATFALLADGGVLAAGLNNYGQLGLENGGLPAYAPTHVAALDGRAVRGVRGGQHHTLVLLEPGVKQGAGAGGEKDSEAGTSGAPLLSFGRPTYGRLGQAGAAVGSDAAAPAPREVDGLGGAALAGTAAGLAVSGAFSEAGDAWLWGFGTSNQLGKGDDDGDEIIPRKLAATKKLADQRVIALEFGGQHAALLCVPRPAQKPTSSQA